MQIQIPTIRSLCPDADYFKVRLHMFNYPFGRSNFEQGDFNLLRPSPNIKLRLQPTQQSKQGVLILFSRRRDIATLPYVQ